MRDSWTSKLAAAAKQALAMRLALAYYVERCIEDGTIESHADAARRLGITRARMTQVMDLMLFAASSADRLLSENPDLA